VRKDGSTAYATISLTVRTDPTDAVTATVERAAQQAWDVGMTAEIGGAALVPQPTAGAATEELGVMAAFVMLLLAFGSLAVAGMPLLTAGLGVGASMATITALALALDLSSTTGAPAEMPGLVVGIDYTVFIISHYHEERAGA
jgi:putative drug exporter of the RND superfamily